MDPITQATSTIPTALSTPVGDPAPGATPAVSVAPLSGTPPAPGSTPAVSVSSPETTLAQQYEQRLSNLMSKWQKAEGERNEVLTRNVELQRQLTELQNTATSTLSTAASTTQQAIDQATAAHARISQLEGELRKAETLRQHPELLPYADFIPVVSTAEEQQQVVEKLKAIREQDMQKLAAGQPTVAAQPVAGTPVPTNGTLQQQQAFFNLLNNRATLPPTILAQNPLAAIGSTPATMGALGSTGSTPQTIDQLLSDARKSGDPVAFERAIEQAKVLAQTSINNQMGRG